MSVWWFYVFVCVMEGAMHIFGGPFLPIGGKVALEIYNFENCPDGKDLKVYIENTTFTMDPELGKMFVSGTAHFKVSMDQKTKQLFEIKRCRSTDELSCEKYLDYTFTNMCELITKKNTTWSPFFEAIQNFEPKCPLKTGTYKIVDAPLDTGDALTSISVLQGHWRLRYVAYIDNKMIACTNTAVEMRRKRTG